MIPVEVVTQIAGAVREIFAFLQTPAGQKVVEKSLADQAAFAKWIQDAGKWLEEHVKAGKAGN